MPLTRTSRQSPGSSRPLPSASTHTDRLPSEAPAHTLTGAAAPPLADGARPPAALRRRSAVLARRALGGPPTVAAGSGTSATHCTAAWWWPLADSGSPRGLQDLT